MPRSVAALIAGAALLAVPFASGAETEPISVPAIISMTGTAAFVGQTEAKGLAILEESINKAGGVNGRPIKFDISDDQSSTAVSVQLATQMVAQHVPVIVGPVLAASCSGIAPLVKDGPVSICISPAIHPEPGSFIFSPSASTLDIARATANYAKKRGWKRIAFIYTTDGSGVDGQKVEPQAFGAPGVTTKIVASETFGVTDLSVAAQLAHIKAANPDAVYIYATGSPATTVMRGLQETGLDVPVLTAWSNAGVAALTAFKQYLPKELLIPGPPPMLLADQLPRGKLHDEIAAYDRAFQSAGVHPDALVAAAWDAGRLVVDALKAIGPNPTAEQVRAYIAKTHDFVGVSGIFDFTKIPQRGLDWHNATIVARWDPAKGTFAAVSGLGGN